VAPGPIEKQILLRVRFAELDRTKALQYGVNFISKGALNTIGAISTSGIAETSHCASTLAKTRCESG